MQLSFSHEDYNLIIKLIKSVIVFNRDYTDLYNAVEFFFFFVDEVSECAVSDNTKRVIKFALSDLFFIKRSLWKRG